jgi:hypothetical protein
MPADYDQVLKDLDEQIVKLQAEIATLQAGRPTIVVLRNKYNPPIQQAVGPVGQFASMGPTDAIPLALKGQFIPLTTAQIADKLQAGGVNSKAKDFAASVSATLGQLRDKGVIERVGDGWRLKVNGVAAPDSSIHAYLSPAQESETSYLGLNALASIGR